MSRPIHYGIPEPSFMFKTAINTDHLSPRERFRFERDYSREYHKRELMRYFWETLPTYLERINDGALEPAPRLNSRKPKLDEGRKA